MSPTKFIQNSGWRNLKERSSVQRLQKNTNTRKFKKIDYLCVMNTEILKSFLVKDTLNPKVWDTPENAKNAKLKKKVLDGLNKIAQEFIDYLGDDIFVDDIILTGSLSNFNWSKYSDFDLHVLVDFEQFGKQKDLYKDLFNLKKQAFNDNHDIKIYGYDVELYAQDSDENHTASGQYSIMENEWIKVPKNVKPDIDSNMLKSKIRNWVEKIDSVIDEMDEGKIKKVKEKIKEYRKSGLDKDSEFSYENLVFKYLRRSGHLEKLFQTHNKVIDKNLSIETQIPT